MLKVQSLGLAVIAADDACELRKPKVSEGGTYPSSLLSFFLGASSSSSSGVLTFPRFFDGVVDFLPAVEPPSLRFNF